MGPGGYYIKILFSKNKNQSSDIPEKFIANIIKLVSKLNYINLNTRYLLILFLNYIFANQKINIKYLLIILSIIYILYYFY